MQDWAERQAELARIARLQLFFVGGAPRSGTTWLQQMLDAHPAVSCQGEALFWKHLAEPLDALIGQRQQALAAKNTAIFRHTGGYPLPAAEDGDFLTATAILLAFRQQSAGRDCRAVGEKTPENVFFFPRLKQLFPGAKLVSIARDPRDVLTSAWHFFHKKVPGEDETAAKTAFLRSAMPSLAEGAKAMLAGRQQFPDHTMIVTYEGLQQRPAELLAGVFRFLGVADDSATVQDCLERTAFGAMTGGRAAGVEQSGSFFRKGVVGDWRSTLTPEMNALVLRELGWMFAPFGWTA